MRCCAIVDGCSTGKYLPFYLKRSGYACIHVQSSAALPAAAKNTFNPDDYEARLVFNGDRRELLAGLAGFPIEFIIPGSEPGVELADELSGLLGLFPNEPGCGRRCRDKFLSGEALRARGLRSIKQAKVDSAASARSWARAHGRWPVVIKPLDSGGGDGFRICRDEGELAAALAADLESKTLFDKRIEEVLVQEHVSGTEYVVNTVSRASRHYVESFMVYGKRRLADGRLVCDSTSLLKPSDCPRAEELFQYTFAALDALGLRFGAAHNELILDESGPVLLECNARLHGHTQPIDVISECLGQTQAELTALAYTDPQGFSERTREPYAVKKYLTEVHFVSDVEGELAAVDFLDDIARLPSYHSHRLYCAPGENISRTIDVPTCPGDVFLRSEDRAQVQEDARRVRAWESRGMFRVKKGSSGGGAVPELTPLP